MDNIKMGNFLQTLRKSSGYTQKDIAERFSISNKTVSKWECGDTIPEIPLLCALAELYDVTVDEILNGKKKNDLSGDKPFTDENSKVNTDDYFVEQKMVSTTIMTIISLGLSILGYVLMAVLYANISSIAALIVGMTLIIISFFIYLINTLLINFSAKKIISAQEKSKIKSVKINHSILFMMFFIPAFVASLIYLDADLLDNPFTFTLALFLISFGIFIIIYFIIRIIAYRESTINFLKKYIFAILCPVIFIFVLFMPFYALIDDRFYFIKIPILITSMLFIIFFGIYVGFIISEKLFKIDIPMFVEKVKKIEIKSGILFLIIFIFAIASYSIYPYFYISDGVKNYYYIQDYTSNSESNYLLLFSGLSLLSSLVLWALSRKMKVFYNLGYLMLGITLLLTKYALLNSYAALISNHTDTLSYMDQSNFYYALIAYGIIGIIVSLTKRIRNNKNN